MFVYWLVFAVDGRKHVYLEEAHCLIMARLKAGIAGYLDGYVEGYELDHKASAKVPRQHMRKALAAPKAMGVLAKLG
jgi:hypothetical protein